MSGALVDAERRVSVGDVPREIVTRADDSEINLTDLADLADEDETAAARRGTLPDKGS